MAFSYKCISKAIKVFQKLGVDIDESVNSLDHDMMFETYDINVELTDDLIICFRVVNMGPVYEEDEVWSIIFIYKVPEGYDVNKDYKRTLKEFLKGKIGTYIIIQEGDGELEFTYPKINNLGVEEALRSAINFLCRGDVMEHLEDIKDHLHLIERKD